jgi:hypothetical protein
MKKTRKELANLLRDILEEKCPTEEELAKFPAVDNRDQVRLHALGCLDCRNRIQPMSGEFIKL